jgi:acetyltransferase EpsM
MEIAAFVAPRPMPAEHRQGIAQFASDDQALQHVREASFVLGIAGLGSAALRRKLVELYQGRGATWQSVVHATAWVSPSAQLGAGAVVLAGGVVNTGARVGQHAVVNTGAIVEHDVELGDYSIAAPGVILGGGARVGSDCFLGLGCRVRDHVSIGQASVVGMGAVVVTAMPAGVEVVGIPGRPRQAVNHGNPA